MRMSTEQFLTCMMALSKQSRYPFKGSFLPCLILNKYEVSFFWVFTLRNVVKKSSDNYLNESIIPCISFQYNCQAVLVRVKQKALQRVASLVF